MSALVLGRLSEARSGATWIVVETGGAGDGRRVIVLGGSTRPRAIPADGAEGAGEACEVACASSRAVDVIDVDLAVPDRSTVTRARSLVQPREGMAAGFWRGRLFAAGGLADHG